MDLLFTDANNLICFVSHASAEIEVIEALYLCSATIRSHLRSPGFVAVLCKIFEVSLCVAAGKFMRHYNHRHRRDASVDPTDLYHARWCVQEQDLKRFEEILLSRRSSVILQNIDLHIRIGMLPMEISKAFRACLGHDTWQLDGISVGRLLSGQNMELLLQDGDANYWLLCLTVFELARRGKQQLLDIAMRIFGDFVTDAMYLGLIAGDYVDKLREIFVEEEVFTDFVERLGSNSSPIYRPLLQSDLKGLGAWHVVLQCILENKSKKVLAWLFESRTWAKVLHPISRKCFRKPNFHWSVELYRWYRCKGGKCNASIRFRAVYHDDVLLFKEIMPRINLKNYIDIMIQRGSYKIARHLLETRGIDIFATTTS